MIAYYRQRAREYERVYAKQERQDELRRLRFQQRRLEDGSVHEVLKNFPSRGELLNAVADIASSPEVTLTEYFWIMSYEAK